jgi:hypothetical protein
VLHVEVRICASIVGPAVSSSAARAGTLPGDMRAALQRNAPAGHVACMSTGDPSFEKIRSALAAGYPVAYLQSRYENNLRWAVVAGFWKDEPSNQTWVRTLNTNNRSWPEFVQDWSLSKVGNSTARGLLRSLLGFEPYTMIRWIPQAQAIPDGAGGYRCP